jgi:hypothetical protein
MATGAQWLREFWASGPDARAATQRNLGMPIMDLLEFSDEQPLPGFRWFEVDDAGRMFAPVYGGVQPAEFVGPGFTVANGCPWGPPHQAPGEECLSCGWSGYQNHILLPLIDVPVAGIVLRDWSRPYVLATAEFAGPTFVINPQFGFRSVETVRSARLRIKQMLWAQNPTADQIARIEANHPGVHVVSTGDTAVHEWLWQRYADRVFGVPYGQACDLIRRGLPLLTAGGVPSWQIDLGLGWPRSTARPVATP